MFLLNKKPQSLESKKLYHANNMFYHTFTFKNKCER